MVFVVGSRDGERCATDPTDEIGRTGGDRVLWGDAELADSERQLLSGLAEDERRPVFVAAAAGEAPVLVKFELTACLWG